MTDHRLFGQTDIDEVDGGELSLCCICGKTFLDRRSLHLHVAIDHEKEALTVSDTPPLAHSSTMNQRDEVDTWEAYESQSDAINSGQSSTTEFPSNEHLPSQTSSPAGKSYHCELCNKYFTKSCNLNSHVKAVHKEKEWL